MEELLNKVLIGVGVYYGIGLLAFLVVLAVVVAVFVKILKKF